MKQLGMRLRALREGIGLSQSKFADVIGSTQSSINRYENGQATPTVELLRKYADYFDVSMDYIFARCDDPHGKLYEAKPQPKALWIVPEADHAHSYLFNTEEYTQKVKAFVDKYIQ
jgi:transcriptional regulator with XRE-family HTH domain